MHFVLGTFYLWGGIIPYVAARMKADDPSVSIHTLGVVFPILGIVTNSVLSFGVKIGERVGYKLTIFCCGTMISIAFIIVSFVTNVIGFIFVYCVFIGMSTGFSYMLPILCGWKFFPFNRGRVSGLIIAGYGFGAFIFNIIC